MNKKIKIIKVKQYEKIKKLLIEKKLTDSFREFNDEFQNKYFTYSLAKRKFTEKLANIIIKDLEKAPNINNKAIKLSN